LQNRYSDDPDMQKLLTGRGCDVSTLRGMYDLTPILTESVYKDFAKYHETLDYTFNKMEYLEQAAEWLYQRKMNVLKSRRPHYLNFDEVLEGIDKTKSATTFFAGHPLYKNKGSVLLDVDFLKSFVIFLDGYSKGEPYYIPFSAFQKEEIRPHEKILLKKMRSIVVGSIYSLILGHMLYEDMDIKMQEGWIEFMTGIGMSPFFGDYDRFIRRVMKPKNKFYWYSDIGKYDSRQAFIFSLYESYVSSRVYGDHRPMFYDLLGSLKKYAEELGIEDFELNPTYLRCRLVEDECLGPTILPHGEVVLTERGEKSGNHRTGHANTGRYKLVEFTAASQFYDSLADYERDGNVEFHTGDDEIGSGPRLDVHEETLSIWRSLGADVEDHVVDNIYDTEYLAARPVMVKLDNGLEFFAPSFNTSKVVAGLCFKNGNPKKDPLIDMNRLCAARLLAQWTDDKDMLTGVITDWKKANPFFADHILVNHSEREVVSFYIGDFESSFLDKNTPSKCHSVASIKDNAPSENISVNKPCLKTLLYSSLPLRSGDLEPEPTRKSPNSSEFFELEQMVPILLEELKRRSL